MKGNKTRSPSKPMLYDHHLACLLVGEEKVLIRVGPGKAQVNFLSVIGGRRKTNEQRVWNTNLFSTKQKQSFSVFVSLHIAALVFLSIPMRHLRRKWNQLIW